MKHLQDLIYWVKEREKIRHLKESGYPWPWTNDPIMRDYRFCNVYREDDKVTRWITDNWLADNTQSPRLAFAAGVARMVNHPDTLQDLGFPHTWDANHFIMTIEARKIAKLKCWTSAYMITGGYSKGGEPKEVIVARVLAQLYDKLAANPITPSDTLESASKKIAVDGIGTFLRGQIIADLKNTPLLGYASDWSTWCAIGPGSTAGLNYLNERKPCILPEDVFRKEVQEVRDLIFDNTGHDLCAQNAQNVLCEFSKYVRTKYYGGRPKASYLPL
jgi:hypothetical protein